MEKVVAELGELVEVDEMVEERGRMDTARILIRTNLRPGIEKAVPAVIDGVDVIIHIVEDMQGLGRKTKPKQSPMWYPPSPLSTEPNSLTTYAGRTPGDDTDGASLDGGLGGFDGGLSGHWHRTRSFLAGRVLRTQPTHNGHIDWSDAVKPDVAQSCGDNHRVEDQSQQGPNNGHLRQEGKVFKASSHSGCCVDAQMEKAILTQTGAAEEQKEDTAVVADFNQNEKGVVALSGSKDGMLEGEKQIIDPFDERIACSRGQYNCLQTSTPLTVGPSHSQREGGGVGPANNRPI